MKREDLWVLLGEAPTEMIEEASTAQTGKKVLWLRWVLPLAAAVVLLTATVLAAGKYFGWQQVLETKPEELTESTEPLGVTVNAEDITFTVTEALADERVLYLLWEMQAPAAIFDERSTADGWLDFGEASVDTGGGYIFSAERPKEKSNILCGYLVADWNDAMRGSTAHLRVSRLGHLERTADTFIAKVDMKALCDSAVRKGVDLDEWISNYPQMIGDGEGSYEVVNTDGEVVQTIDMAYYEAGRLYVFSRSREDCTEPDSPPHGVLCDSTGERVENVGGRNDIFYSVDYYDVAEEELPNLQYIQPGRWQRVPDYDAEWEVNFDIPQTVESVELDAAEGVTVKCSPVSMEITINRPVDSSLGWAVYLKDGTEVKLRSRDGNQTATKTEMKMIFCRAIAPEEIEAIYCGGVNLLRQSPAAEDEPAFEEIFDRYYYREPFAGYRLEEPVRGVTAFYSRQKGTPFTALQAGTVVYTADKGWNQGMGRCILIRQENGLYAVYAHCEELYVQAGDEVIAYTQLGTTGDSGNFGNGSSGVFGIEFSLVREEDITLKTARDGTVTGFTVGRNAYENPVLPMETVEWTEDSAYIAPVKNGTMSRGVIGASCPTYRIFEAPAGTAAVAMRDGVVEKVPNKLKEGMTGEMGRENLVLIRHEDGSVILYGHLKNVTLKPGDTVKQGEKIGECSDRGNTWAAGVGVIYYSAYPEK